MISERETLERLARHYGVLAAFRDGFQREREAPSEAILAALRALGAPVAEMPSVPAALAEARLERWRGFAPPAAAAWEGDAVRLPLRLPEREWRGDLEVRLTLEEGGTSERRIPAEELPAARAIESGGERFQMRTLDLGVDLPAGYHQLHLALGERRAETFLIRAPKLCHVPAGVQGAWGVFLPAYSLHSESSWGAGDLTDFGRLCEWVRELGGSLAGSLPLLAAFLDEPYEYSPYVPASRLFWNEFYADPRRAPEWERSPEARRIAASDGFRAEVEALRGLPLVDYRRQMALKRGLLDALAQTAFEDADAWANVKEYAAARPGLDSYAGFRAVGEVRGETWRQWPERLRGGRLEPGDYDAASQRRHLYGQWLAERQIAELARSAGSPGLYLDLPLGVHSGGFDVWRSPDSFAPQVTGGAPPDRFFTKGQNWGFAPLHPQAGRRGRYRYLIDCLRHHMRHAGVLRIDHFMWLHRLYWVPEGAEASEGTYVRYPADELYAILSLESNRQRTLIVGEDLGTVPDYVRSRMAEHSIDRMYVAQFSFRDDPNSPLESPPPSSLASVNTHDTPTFKSFWEALEVDDQVAMGLLDEQEAAETRERRARLREAAAAHFGVHPHSAEVLRAVLRELARSPARCLLINLEDLWDEAEPQNTPGTGPERPNWRRRARLSLEQIQDDRGLADLLREVGRLREAARVNRP